MAAAAGPDACCLSLGHARIKRDRFRRNHSWKWGICTWHHPCLGGMAWKTSTEVFARRPAAPGNTTRFNLHRPDEDLTLMNTPLKSFALLVGPVTCSCYAVYFSQIDLRLSMLAMALLVVTPAAIASLFETLADNRTRLLPAYAPVSPRHLARGE